jgi:hypothetical protein
VPLTGLTLAQIHTVAALTRQRLPPRTARPWGLPLPVRVLLVLLDLRTNLTTRALAALFTTSQSTAERIIDHLVPLLAEVLRPDNSNDSRAWIIAGMLIPVQDRSVTAISTNYRRSANTQIIICAHRPRVDLAAQCWPGNHNDVVVARHTVIPPRHGRVVLGERGYRDITWITTPTRPLRPDHPR